ncbi:MAG: hydroxymethylbilane synthase, partial [bacterium]
VEILPPERFLPAPGQGAMAVEIRADDRETAGLVSSINHAASFVALSTERAFLEELKVGCSVPVGAWARLEQGRLVMTAAVLSPDGREMLENEGFADSFGEAERLGRTLAQDLISRGATRLLA